MSGAVRAGSRLEVDDEDHCKWCGKELPAMLVHGPLAGGDSECAPVELCGTCKADQWKRIVRYTRQQCDACNNGLYEVRDGIFAVCSECGDEALRREVDL